MDIDYQIEMLKKISIRGRFAFGMTCLEQYAKENELSDELSNRIFDNLWEFTTTNKLDVWEEKISNSHDIEIFCNSSDKDFVSMIKKVIEIGTGNLYGGTDQYSSWTLEPTLELLKLSELKIKQMPKIKSFQFSKFSEDGGWGNIIIKDNLE